MYLEFVVYCHPEPQGSSRGFVGKGKNGKPRAIITSDNAKLKPFRQAVAQSVAAELSQVAPVAEKHVPVGLRLDFFFEKPPSVPKKRLFPVVKPDLDKLCRSTLDALTGILFADDSQVVKVDMEKHYGTPERIEIGFRMATGEKIAVKEPYEIKAAAVW